MTALTRRQEAALLDCLRAIAGGSTIEACLARHPEDAPAIRPYLQIEATLLDHARSVAADPVAQDAGRRALLDAVVTSAPPTSRLPGFAVLGTWAGALENRLRGLFGGWRPVTAPVLRFAVVALALLVLGGGAIGASAAGGFEPARDVLAALRIVDRSNDGATAALPDGPGDTGGARDDTQAADQGDTPQEPGLVVATDTGDACDAPPCDDADQAFPEPSDDPTEQPGVQPPTDDGKDNGDPSDDPAKPSDPPAVDPFCQAHPRLCQAIADFCKDQPDRCQNLKQFCRAQPDRCRLLISFCRAQPDRCRDLLDWCRAQPERCREIVDFCRNHPLRCRQIVQFCQAQPDVCRAVVQFCQTHPERCRDLAQWCATYPAKCQQLVEFCIDHPQQCLQAIQQCLTNATACLQAPSNLQPANIATEPVAIDATIEVAASSAGG